MYAQVCVCVCGVSDWRKAGECGGPCANGQLWPVVDARRLRRQLHGVRLMPLSDPCLRELIWLDTSARVRLSAHWAKSWTPRSGQGASPPIGPNARFHFLTTPLPLETRSGFITGTLERSHTLSSTQWPPGTRRVFYIPASMGGPGRLFIFFGLPLSCLLCGTDITRAAIGAASYAAHRTI